MITIIKYLILEIFLRFSRYDKWYGVEIDVNNLSSVESFSRFDKWYGVEMEMIIWNRGFLS